MWLYFYKNEEQNGKKSEITHKQSKVECIQLTKFMANIQKWNHYKTNVKWIMTILLMSVLTSEQTFDLVIKSSNVKAKTICRTWEKFTRAVVLWTSEF